MGNLFNKKLEKQRNFLEGHIIQGENLNTWSDSQLSRLDGIMHGDTTVEDKEDRDGNRSVHKVSFEDTFLTFCDEHSAWKDPNVVLFWNNYPELKLLMVIRRQRSGLCLMHAPVVLQHYLISINSHNSTFSETIDISKYLDQNRRGAALLEYLKDNQGGNSIEFLNEIFASDSKYQHDSYHIRSDVNKSCEEFLNKLATQPTLISKFPVDHCFLEKKNGTSFLYESQFTRAMKPAGYHAMLLVGYRRDDNEIIFLLQNWWKDRYLIEVSTDYLRKCDVTITFASSSLIEIPNTFPIIRGTYVETSVDCGETYDEI